MFNFLQPDPEDTDLYREGPVGPYGEHLVIGLLRASRDLIVRIVHFNEGGVYNIDGQPFDAGGEDHEIVNPPTPN